jgi:E3 ubiquitin-protein ligase HECTD2
MSNTSTAVPLSTARTRALIEQCIKAYLLNRFEAEYKEKSPVLSIFLDNGHDAPQPNQDILRSLPGKTFLEHTEMSNSAKNIQHQIEGTRDIFRPLEDYIITSFTSRECINTSFTSVRPGIAPRAASEGARRATGDGTDDRYYQASVNIPEMDAKTLLIGNFARNGAWWTGKRESLKVQDRSRSHHKNLPMEASSRGAHTVTLKSPRIDWIELNEWYALVLQAGSGWKRHLHDIVQSNVAELWDECLPPNEMDEIEGHILEAQARTQRVLLKATESLLKRPGSPLKQPDDIRFLLIILANPLLYPSYLPMTGRQRSRSPSKSREPRFANILAGPGTIRHDEFTASLVPSHEHSTGPGQHSGVVKRVLGLLSNLPNECHHHLVAWFARFSNSHFQKVTELVGSFVTHRLSRQHGKQQILTQDPTADLIPRLGTTRQGTSAALHAILSMSEQRSKKPDNWPRPVVYNDDWQIKAAARVMALLFSANNLGLTNVTLPVSTTNSISISTREILNHHGQILAVSSFYNTLLDYSDLVADFEAWEAGRGKFSFCQYPFFLSIWAKIQIMEHDARRQMEVKAREAFFDSIMTRKTVNQYLILRIRRECLVEDSLKGVSEVVGSGGEEIKKGLRIEFKGEEGIDAGGLRKEWFLLLVRDVFNPEHGMLHMISLITYPDQYLRHVRL